MKVILIVVLYVRIIVKLIAGKSCWAITSNVIAFCYLKIFKVKFKIRYLYLVINCLIRCHMRWV